MTGDTDVFSVKEWPQAGGKYKVAQKSPTLIAYPNWKFAIPWGYQVEGQSNICAWMKYHLDENRPLTKYDDRGLAEAISTGLFKARDGKQPDDVAVDYLKRVFETAVQHFSKELGGGDIKAGGRLLSVTPAQWWLARPAMWDQQAQLRLQTIVEKAAASAAFCRREDELGFVSDAYAAAYALLSAAAAQDELTVRNWALANLLLRT